MTETIRIGVIGAGGIAGVHVNHYKKIPYVQVVAVSDVVPGRAAEFIARHELSDAKAFDDYRELLDMDLDAVSVCTPNASHYQPVMDALAAGKHVMVEKPLSVTLDEGIKMVRAAQNAQRLLNVGFQSRFDAVVKTAKELIKSGTLGDPYYAETGGGRRKGIPGGTFVSKDLAGGGVMLDIGCYSIDTTLYLLGNPRPLTVSAVMGDHFGRSAKYARRASWGSIDPDKFDVEDFGVALIRLEGGITFVMRITWAMHLDTLGPSIILGTDAGLKIEGRNIKLFHDQAGRNAETIIQAGSSDDNSNWTQKVKTFVDAIRDGKPAPIPASEILYGQAILDAAYQSAKLGREIAIELPDDLGL